MARLRLIVRLMAQWIFYILFLINTLFVFMFSRELSTVLTAPVGDYPFGTEQHFFYCSKDVYVFQIAIFLFLYGQSLVLGWFFARLKKIHIAILFLIFPLLIWIIA